MYPRNAATPPLVFAKVVNASTGAPITSGVTVYLTVGTDEGAGSGAARHEGNGLWSYAPTQAETNYTAFGVDFYHADAVGDGPCVSVVTTAINANGLPNVALKDILATALTETVGGYLTAAFKKLFDVATPVLTAASVNQTIDNPTAAAIADAVFDETSTGHTDAGKAGAQVWTVINTIAVDVAGLDGAAMRGTDSAALASVCTEGRLAELDAANLPTDVANVKIDTAAILIDTAVIGAAGAGLTAVPWNAAWDAEVQSECADAITAASLSTLTTAQVNAEVLDVLNVDTLIDGKTFVSSQRIIAAAAIGEVSGAGTGTEIFVGLDAATTRATVTVDASGNRTAVVYV